MHLFKTRKVFQCAICGRDVKHKYKAPAELKIQGFICSDCHIEKTREYYIQQQINEVQPKKDPPKCAVCARESDDGKIMHKPRWQWNMQSGDLLCDSCFGLKEEEFQRRLNKCAVCGGKLGFIRYNPKKPWNVEGQLCRACWDLKNETKSS